MATSWLQREHDQEDDRRTRPRLPSGLSHHICLPPGVSRRQWIATGSPAESRISNLTVGAAVSARRLVIAGPHLRGVLGGGHAGPTPSGRCVAMAVPLSRWPDRWRSCPVLGATLSVQQTRIRGAEGLAYGSPKTAKGRRRIALDAATVVALRAHRRAQQAAERLLAGSIWQDEDLVFCRQDGQPLDPDSVSQSFERLGARAGLPRIRLHDARHTAASLLLAAGVHPKVVQERLGHATIATTLDTYSHVLPGLGEDAAERLAAAIDGAR